MAAVSLRHLHKAFPNGHVAVRDVSLEIADGELLVLVGPSGCGKSTVLRLIAGLEAPTSGAIAIAGADVTALPPQQRDLAMVFQNYALYPHKTVRDNLAFGLRVRGTDPSVAADRVARTAAALDLGALLDRRPAQLSGGQRQRVALGRALVREPRAFLLDEPLSNLDPLLRAATRAELALLHRRLGATMVYVTHDQEEAMTLGGRIAVMNAGAIEQVAAPLEIFERPATVFVARFVGSPSMNLWPGRLSRSGGDVRVAAAGMTIALGDRTGHRVEDVKVVLGVRPHHVAIVAAGDGDVDGEVEVVEPLGAVATVHVRVARMDDLVRVQTAGDAMPRIGQAVGLSLDRERLHLFETATERRLSV